MLNRLSDFYRIVNPDPSDTLITQRKEAIVVFMGQFSSPGLQYACADIAAFGLGTAPSATRAEAAKSIIAAIQGPQPSFSSDIGANPLDLRVFAGIALGEHLATHSDGTTAALVISALATRALPQERYLAEFVSALLQVARRSAEAAGNAQRRRPDLEITGLQGADIATFSQSVKSALDEFKEAVDRNLRVDREELEILWYVFGGRSTTLEKPFHAIDISQRILASGSELAEIVIVPPVMGSAQFLHAILKDDRPLTLRHLIDPCNSVLLESIARRRAATTEVLMGHPALLPLTWLSCRRLDSGMASGWEGEFEQKTHISAGDERTASNWATQVFNECIATRLLAEAGE